MGCCSSKSGQTSSCCKVFCCCCCCCKEERSEESHNKQQSLPEPRTEVPTYDVAAAFKIQRPTIKTGAEMSETTAAFLSFSQNMDRPSDVDRSVIIGKTSPIQYVRLDDAQILQASLKPSSDQRTSNTFKMIEMPEEATKM